MVNQPDTVSLVLHSFAEQKTVLLYRGYLAKEEYYLDFQQAGLPKERFILQYRSSFDTATTIIKGYGKTN